MCVCSKCDLDFLSFISLTLVYIFLLLIFCICFIFFQPLTLHVFLQSINCLCSVIFFLIGPMVPFLIITHLVTTNITPIILRKETQRVSWSSRQFQCRGLNQVIVIWEILEFMESLKVSERFLAHSLLRALSVNVSLPSSFSFLCSLHG